jgi:hypothetical protein
LILLGGLAFALGAAAWGINHASMPKPRWRA